MIYEKINGDFLVGEIGENVKKGNSEYSYTDEKRAVKTDKNAVGEVGEKAKKTQTENTVQICEKISFSDGKKRKKRGKTRRRAKMCFVVATLTLFFCMRTLDEKVFERKGEEILRVLAAKGLEKAYTAVVGENLSFDDISATNRVNNIYTDFAKENKNSSLYGNEIYDKEKNTENTEKETLPDFDNGENDGEGEKEAVSVMTNSETSFSSDGEKYYPITSHDLSAKSVFSVTNGTSYSPNMEKIGNKNPPALENLTLYENEPTVLIVHTHATECYTEHKNMYPANESTRSTDMEKNVVRVGEKIKEVLESYGIRVIHSTRLCDEESFIDAYNVSHDEVEKYLEEYPSIRIVIDVHRDAIIKENGEGIRPVAQIAGENYAQLMFVVGTGESAHSHPSWENNLSLALKIQREGTSRYPGLFRSVNLRSVPFNQWLSDGYLLLEVGSCSNTLDEALLSAQAFGHSLSAVIKESAKE